MNTGTVRFGFGFPHSLIAPRKVPVDASAGMWGDCWTCITFPSEYYFANASTFAYKWTAVTSCISNTISGGYFANVYSYFNYLLGTASTLSTMVIRMTENSSFRQVAFVYFDTGASTFHFVGAVWVITKPYAENPSDFIMPNDKPSYIYDFHCSYIYTGVKALYVDVLSMIVYPATKLGTLSRARSGGSEGSDPANGSQIRQAVIDSYHTPPIISVGRVGYINGMVAGAAGALAVPDEVSPFYFMGQKKSLGTDARDMVMSFYGTTV